MKKYELKPLLQQSILSMALLFVSVNAFSEVAVNCEAIFGHRDKMDCYEAKASLTPKVNEQPYLSSDYFKDNATVVDDSIDTVAKISTGDSYKPILRVFINKTNGNALFQVYQNFSYGSKNWRNYYKANYETLSGPKSIDITHIGKDIDCSSLLIHETCTFTEIVAFDIDENLLRTIADTYKQDHEGLWSFKFYSHSGNEGKESMRIAQIKGTLEKYDEYRSNLGISSAR